MERDVLKLIQRHRKHYHFKDIKSEYILYRIWNSVVVGSICKSREIMFSNKMLCSFLHDISIELISTVVSKVSLKWVHDGVIIYLVMISLAFCRKPGMEFRHRGANFSNSDISRKKTVQGRVNAFQVVVVKRGDKVCHLKSLQKSYVWELPIRE